MNTETGEEIIATVENIGHAKESDQGVFHWVLFRNEENKDKLWHRAFPEELKVLRQGQRVGLLPSDEKKRWNVRVLEQPEDRIYQPMDEAMKARISAYIEDQADILVFCSEVAKTKLGGSAEEIEKYAMALYIAAQRKFGL